MIKGIKTAQVLSFIGNSGKDGRTFSEIQRFVVEMNGLNYDEKNVDYYYPTPTGPAARYVRRYRGYWTAALCGTNGFYSKPRIGILKKYCEKVGKKYILKGVDSL